MGRSREVSRVASPSEIRASARASARPRTITASGLASRCFRARRRRTASSSPASHARWKPPSPRTARILPPVSRSPAPRKRHVVPEGHDSIDLEPHPRPARRAGVRLGVVAPIRGVVVLAQTLGALGEGRHRAPLPVVRHRLDDREAGSAVRARDERVAVAPVGGIVELGGACRAHRHVRRDGESAHRRHVAHQDPEVVGTAPFHRSRVEGVDAGQRRRFRPEPVHERRQRRVLPLGPDSNGSGLVAHPPADPVAQRQAVHEGAEADTLDHAPDPDLDAPVGEGLGVGERGQGARHRQVRAGARAWVRRNPYQRSIPSPVSAEVKKNCRSGFTSRAQATALSTSKGR